VKGEYVLALVGLAVVGVGVYLVTRPQQPYYPPMAERNTNSPDLVRDVGASLGAAAAKKISTLFDI